MFGRFRIILWPILFVVTLLAGIGGSLAFRNTLTQEVAAIASADRIYDFGTVRAGKVIRHTFLLDNPGQEPVSLEQVQTTCGCTVAGVESKVIAPGESVQMPVTLNTKGRSGKLSQSVRVSFSVGEPRSYTLQGFVASDELKPLQLGTVLRGDTARNDLTLNWPPGLALEISEVHFNEKKLRVDVRPGDGAHAISIALREDVPYGPLSESVIMHTNDPLVPEKHVNIFAMVSFPILADPDEVTLGLVQPGKPATGTVRIVSPYEEPLQIMSIEHKAGQAVTWREERGGDSEIVLHLSLSAEAERSYYKSVLRVNAVAGEETRRMDIEIYGVGPNLNL